MATSNTTPVVIPQPIAAQATSENINVIPNGATGTNLASFQEGFPAITRMPVIENPLPTQVSGLPPKQQDFNGLFNVVSQHNFFAQNGGTYSFNQAVSDAIGGYPKNAVLWYFPENGTPCLVRSLINDNTNNFVNDPTLIDGIHWEMLVNPSSYANIALTNSPYTTNRILEIPQDIKLELNNGTLTLKTGSKVYVPNGFEANGTTPKFDVVTIENDLTTTRSSNNQETYIYDNRNAFNQWLYHFSGPTAPTGDTFMLWYDTTNNLIKTTVDGGSTWISGHSLPVCLATSNTTQITSIDQVFNGRGYIGSTVFALPGVKVQAPNGKNVDGTYNSSVYTTSTVLTMPIDAGWGTFDIILTSKYLNKWPDVISGSVGTRYNSENNYYEVYDQTNSKWVPLPMQLAIAKVKADTTSPYRITSFEPFTVDSVLNSSLSNLSAAGQNVILNLAAQRGNKTGTIIIWSAPTSPDGYLICNGAAVSRTTYAALFNVIGTTWGAGDGNTTFNLPNMLDYAPWYSSRPVGQYSKGGLPNITGTFGSLNTSKTYSGAFADAGKAFLARYYYDTNDFGRIVSFNASRSSSVYTNYDRIVPANATCLFCIKY